MRLTAQAVRAAEHAVIDLGLVGRAWIAAGQAAWAFGEAIGYCAPETPLGDGPDVP